MASLDLSGVSSWSVAWASARHRWGSLLLLVLSMTLALSVLLAVARVGDQARGHFARSVSSIDLIVGPRGSPLSLVLTSVFRIGQPQQTMSWAAIEALRQHPAVQWVIPLALGDSVHGFPVMATDSRYFDHFRHGDRQPLSFAQGRPFQSHPAGLFEVVLGASVAAHEGLSVGDSLALDHGHAHHDDPVALSQPVSGDKVSDAGPAHADKPFTVVGVLAPTGTPVDQTVHISLQGFEAIHLEWQGGVRPQGFSIPQAFVSKFDLSPKRVNAALVSLNQRTDVFTVQQFVQQYSAEPLSAALPALALDELWRVLSVLERGLTAMSALTGLVCLGALLSIMLASVNQRRRELAILRSVGAQPRQLFALLALEGLACTGLAGILSIIALLGLDLLSAEWMRLHWGFSLGMLSDPSVGLGPWSSGLVLALLISLIPGLRAYRYSLQDGLMPQA